MAKKRTNEEFLEELKQINPNIEPLEEYVNSGSKITCKCKICGYVWNSCGSRLLIKKCGCPKCAGSVKKTNEQFLKELKEVNDNIEPLEEYNGANGKIKVKCLKCNHTWISTPDRLLNKKYGCPKCALIDKSIKTRKNNDEFLKELKEINPNIEPLEEYINRHTKIKFKCKICGNEFYNTPGTILKLKFGCTVCSRKSSSNIRMKSNEDFIEEVSSIKPDIIPLEEYKGAGVKIKFKCKICGYEWKTIPSIIVNTGCGCPNCASIYSGDKTRKTNEKFLKELNEVNSDVEPLEEYDGAFGYVKVKCKICNHIWKTTPDRLLNKKAGCPKCAHKKIHNEQRKTNNSFIKELKERTDDIIPLDEYVDAKTRIKFKCKTCGHIWKTIPNHVINGTGCPKCALSGTSREEQDLIDTLKETINSYIERGIRIKLYKETEENLKNKYLMEERKYFSNNGKRYQLDIYFPNLKLGIEYNGNYWHSTEKLDANYHIDKREFFKDLGIKVIFIRSDEWDFKREKILYRLMSILGLYKMKTYARKLYVDLEVPNFEANKLMELSHIQGKDNSSIKIGLRNKHETLVAVMTFGKSRYLTKTKDDGENTYELIRYCTYPESVIIGGFSKLLKAGEEYLKTLGVTRIKTFADRRFSSDDDNVYLKNGFTLNNISGANYVYVKRYEVLKRYECQKHKLHKILGDNFDENATEYENMVVNNGYTKICDCGNLVYYKNIE